MWETAEFTENSDKIFGHSTVKHLRNFMQNTGDPLSETCWKFFVK